MRFDLKLFLAALLVCAMAVEPALARGHGGRGGHGGGRGAGHHHHHGGGSVALIASAPLFGPWYFPGSAYYDFPPEPSYPTIYIERGVDPAAPADQPAYWYYCPEAQQYYPEVKECPLGWQQLVSRPQS